MTRGQKLYCGLACVIAVATIGLEASGWAAGGVRRDPMRPEHLVKSARGQAPYGGYLFYRGMHGK